ncbi:myotubularin-related protein 12-like isoform X2 [Acipenser ruthenus]|uniref:myotubularin-related protein 12-like isoform X2 n=1 Tax=Acipenser ruthenus TaxID=7906 RepID=UPI0027415A58|nr:myotubularin-related protein 12-like isoform X2 [Acipenser ruthenus]
MLSLGSGGGKSTKPSFVSYVTPEDMKIKEKEEGLRSKHPYLLPGEVVFCSANHVLKYTQEDASQRGVYGTLLCTNFKIAFISDESASQETAPPFRNKLLSENDIPLTCVDHIYGVSDEKKKLIIGGQVKSKYPSKLIIQCKDLRVFHFSLTYAKEEEAKKIFQGIVHHSLEPKSLKCVFAFSYCETASPSQASRKSSLTLMFETKEDWSVELGRTKGNCKVSSANADYVISEKLPQFFVVPFAVSDDDILRFLGKGIPFWCWSHHSGCALFKMACLPTIQEDGISQKYMHRMLDAVTQDQLCPVKIEDLSSCLPALQDLQLSYNKFKQLFLIDSTTEFWVSDMKWFSSLENSGWLEIIRQCLMKAVEIVDYLESAHTSVLIVEEHCSDLCCVLSSLVQIMLDPYYRTRSGFQSLIQKEWVAGGHSFLDRCNHLYQKEKEVPAPVFLLFLECVWQLLQQHAPAFQFSETYLTVLSDSINIPLFSTFLFNSQHHRDTAMKPGHPEAQRSPLNFPSVWDWSLQFDCKAQSLFTNPLYVAKPIQDKALRKTSHQKHQRQLSLPNTLSKPSPRKGFFKEETDNLKKIFLGKRISKWLNPTESSKELYESWQRKPLDYQGLLLPYLDGPSVRVWMQRYLRWVPEAQIFGGGSITTVNRVLELASEIQDLQKEVERRSCRMNSSTAWTQVYSGPPLSARLSSFPFTATHAWSFKPAIPSSIRQSLGSVSSLADKEDDDCQGSGVL